VNNWSEKLGTRRENSPTEEIIHSLMMAERKLWIQVVSNVITSGVFALDWRRGVYVHGTATVRTMTSLPSFADPRRIDQLGNLQAS